MPDETMNHADIEQDDLAAIDEHETPEVEEDEGTESEATEEESEADDADGEGAEEGDEPEAEYVTVERNGKAYKVPKELEGELLMQADYTRKTQETAELRRTLEKREHEIAQKAQVSQEELQARVSLAGIEQQLNQYRQMTPQDWRQMEQDDPWSLQNHRTNMLQLQQQHQQLTEALRQVEHKRSEDAKQEAANRLAETRKYAEAKIPGWSPEVDAKITGFATGELGFDVDTLKEAYNPQVYNTLYLAWLGHQTLQKQAAKPATPKPAQKPLNKVGGKSNPPARKSISDMSMDEYAAYMNQREAKRAKR